MPYQIPKRIIQTGKHHQQPLLNRAMMTSIRLLNPDYEYLFFDDVGVEEFIEREFPEYRELFHSFPFRIQRFDFFRYLAVYRYGGFYFDVDVMLASGVSDLLDYGCVFPFEGLTLNLYLRRQHNMDWELGNFAFGAAPEHPFIGALIKNCVRGQREPDWVAPMMRGFPPIFRSEYVVLNTTGPGAVSRTFAENAALAKSVKVLFPKDIFDLNDWNCFGDYGVHLMDGSWRTQSGYARRRLAQRWENWKLARVIEESRRLRNSNNKALLQHNASHGSTAAVKVEEAVAIHRAEKR
jgi:hypothetical protein